MKDAIFSLIVAAAIFGLFAAVGLLVVAIWPSETLPEPHLSVDERMERFLTHSFQILTLAYLIYLDLKRDAALEPKP